MSDGYNRTKAILLIYPDTGIKSFYPPHAYLCLGAALKQAGFQVSILDQRLEIDFFASLDEHLESARPLFVGISTMTGTQIGFGLSISRHIKNHSPHIPIVWGGVHPTLLPHQTIQNENIDIVVKNEGEQTCIELARAYSNNQPLDGVEGILYKENGEVKETADRAFIDLNECPPPDWSLVDVEKYIIVDSQHKRRLDLYTSRGCPFNCGFCYNAVFNKRLWRARSSQSVLEEIFQLVSSYKIEHIWFSDDNFMANRNRVLEICDGIIKSQMALTFTGASRPENICADHELMKYLVQAGFRKLYMGAESGSERILNLINRTNNKSYCLQAAEVCKEYNIIPIFSFMIGFPGESKEEVRETLSFAKQLKSINNDAIITDFKIYAPYPGTPLFDLAVKQGLVMRNSLEEWRRYTWGNIDLPWVSDMQFLRTVSLVSLFSNYYQELQQESEKGTLPFRVSLRLLKWLANIRWQTACFALPLEWIGFSYIISKVSQSKV